MLTNKLQSRTNNQHHLNTNISLQHVTDRTKLVTVVLKIDHRDILLEDNAIYSITNDCLMFSITF